MTELPAGADSRCVLKAMSGGRPPPPFDFSNKTECPVRLDEVEDYLLATGLDLTSQQSVLRILDYFMGRKSREIQGRINLTEVEINNYVLVKVT